MPVIAGGVWNTSVSTEAVQAYLRMSLHIRQETQNIQVIEQSHWSIIAGHYAHDHPGDQLTLLRDGDDTYGIAIGRLFQAGPEQIGWEIGDPAPPLPSLSASAIIASQGKWLNNRVWGRYIIVCGQPHRKALWVCRDPAGMLNVFFAVVDGGYLFASELRVLMSAFTRTPAYNWKHLARFIAYGPLPLIETAFHGIEQAEPGTCTLLRPAAKSATPFWQAADIAEAPVKPDPEELLRRLCYCSQQWLQHTDQVWLNLSGGIDSSSLAVAMTRSGTSAQVMARHRSAGADATGNEVDFAQAVANQVGIPLQLLQPETDYASIALSKASQWKWDKPFDALRHLGFDRDQQELSLRQQPTELVSGLGGDTIFLSLGSNADHAIDYLLYDGFKAFIREVYDLAYQHTAPFGRVLIKSLSVLAAHATRYQRQGGIMSYALVLPDLAPPDWITHVGCIRHNIPWYPVLADLPVSRLGPAKIRQILTTAFMIENIERPSGTPHTIPALPLLLSLPVLEYALACPISALVGAHGDRLLLRAASRPHLPATIAMRMTKGSAGGLIQKEVAQQREILYDWLLEGFLVREGLLDRTLLCKELEQLAQGTSQYMMLVVNALAAEHWVRSWMSIDSG